jgi:hypothetical protein
LTLLIARNDPGRHPRFAARWLLRFLEEHPEATIEDALLVGSCLAALVGVSYREAAQTLRSMAERATSRRRAKGVEGLDRLRLGKRVVGKGVHDHARIRRRSHPVTLSTREEAEAALREVLVDEPGWADSIRVVELTVEAAQN